MNKEMIIVLDFGGQYNVVSVNVMCMQRYIRTPCRLTRSRK